MDWRPRCRTQAGASKALTVSEDEAGAGTVAGANRAVNASEPPLRQQELAGRRRERRQVVEVHGQGAERTDAVESRDARPQHIDDVPGELIQKAQAA